MKKRPASCTFRSFFESKFKAPKTPPSHGFRGFDAIKAGAKRAGFHRGAARLTAGFQNVAVSEMLKLRPGWAASWKRRQSAAELAS